MAQANTMTNTLAQTILRIAKEAGDKIMAIYDKDFAIYEKQDTSPLTEADLAAHNVIVDALGKESDLPILSEESADISWDERKQWQSYWLVDPLDGTKEFIKKNGATKLPPDVRGPEMFISAWGKPRAKRGRKKKK